MNTTELLSKINETYAEYIKDPKYVYMSCNKYWIVILQKLDDTITNENICVKDANYAKYKANKLMPVLIFNKIDYNDKIGKIKFTNCETKIKYVVGNIYHSNNYNNNIINSELDYYKTIEPAFYSQIEKDISNGLYNEWYDNGQLQTQGTYVDGKKHLVWSKFYDQGNKISEHSYNNGIEYYYNSWYPNGNRHESIIFTYVSTSTNIQITKDTFSPDGKQQSRRSYMNDVKHGQWYIWYKNGQMYSSGYYFNGKKDGYWTFWHENGKVWRKRTYKDDKIKYCSIM